MMVVGVALPVAVTGKTLTPSAPMTYMFWTAGDDEPQPLTKIKAPLTRSRTPNRTPSRAGPARFVFISSVRQLRAILTFGRFMIALLCKVRIARKRIYWHMHL